MEKNIFCLLRILTLQEKLAVVQAKAGGIGRAVVRVLDPPSLVPTFSPSPFPSASTFSSSTTTPPTTSSSIFSTSPVPLSSTYGAVPLSSPHDTDDFTIPFIIGVVGFFVLLGAALTTLVCYRRYKLRVTTRRLTASCSGQLETEV